MSKRHHLWAVAGLLVGRYGAEARAKAMSNADEAAEAGDGETRAFWSDVGGALTSRRDPSASPPPGDGPR